MKPTDNCPSGKRALNKEKNRYRNVLPCKFTLYTITVFLDTPSYGYIVMLFLTLMFLDEKTRVVLSGDEQVDYINANYINITVGSDTFNYIATQVMKIQKNIWGVCRTCWDWCPTS